MAATAEFFIRRRLSQEVGDGKGNEEPKLRWWQDRIDWPFPRVNIVAPALYDRHVTYESALDIFETTVVFPNPAPQVGKLPRNWLQRLLLVH